MGFKVGPLWGHGNGALMNGISTPGSFLSLSTTLEYSKEKAFYEPGNGPSSGTKSAGILIFGLPRLQNGETQISVVYKPCSLWYSVRASPLDSGSLLTNSNKPPPNEGKWRENTSFFFFLLLFSFLPEVHFLPHCFQFTQWDNSKIVQGSPTLRGFCYTFFGPSFKDGGCILFVLFCCYCSSYLSLCPYCPVLFLLYIIN